MNNVWCSRRSDVFSKNGMIAASQPLAAEIGISILKKGGNAADAAVAVAAALNVTEPTSTGIGGDCFCLFYNNTNKTVEGLNASGRCPAGLSVKKLAELGYSEIARPEKESPLWITVPGAAAGWVETVELFGSGKLNLAEILDPAIALAENGFPVAPICARDWQLNQTLLQSASKNGHEMLLNGQAPRAGDIMKMPTLASTFRELALHGKQGFYEGRVAEEIVKVVNSEGGIITMKDLNCHSTTRDTPISVNYKGIDIYEMPPNGQGVTALLALNILKGFDLGQFKHNSEEHLHLVIEALRLAFADTSHYVADPLFSQVPVGALLSNAYAEKRRNLIKTDVAIADMVHGYPCQSSCTVYFGVTDSNGNACSFINSNYMGFGTGIIPKGCGFTLHNRGENFSLNPASSNCLQPQKRPYHTIIPGMAIKNGELFCSFGVMGGFMQPQGHVQVLSNLIDFRMSPQEALDSPRVQINGGASNGDILLEEGISEETRAGLQALGHKNPKIISGWERACFGGGQIIQKLSTGCYCAGSDPRKDGLAIGY